MLALEDHGYVPRCNRLDFATSYTTSPAACRQTLAKRDGSVTPSQGRARGCILFRTRSRTVPSKAEWWTDLANQRGGIYRHGE